MQPPSNGSQGGGPSCPALTDAERPTPGLPGADTTQGGGPTPPCRCPGLSSPGTALPSPKSGSAARVGLALRRRGNVPAVVDAGRYRLFQGVDGASEGLLTVIPEGGQLREVGDVTSTVPSSSSSLSDRKASFQPQVFLDLRYESSSQLLAASVHRKLAGAVSEPDGEMSASALVGVEGASLLPQSASEFSCVHPLTSYTTIALLSTVCVVSGARAQSPQKARHRGAVGSPAPGQRNSHRLPSVRTPMRTPALRRRLS